MLGAMGVFNVLTSRGTLEMSCGKYLTERPHSKWVRLDGCVLSRIETVTRSSKGKLATEVYIPVRPAVDTGRTNPQILLASSAERDTDFVNQLNGSSSQRMNQAGLRANYGDKFEETRVIEGRVLRGGEFTDRDRAKLLKTLPILASDFVVIEECARPGFLAPLGFIFAGVLLIALRIYLVVAPKLPVGERYLADEEEPALS